MVTIDRKLHRRCRFGTILVPFWSPLKSDTSQVSKKPQTVNRFLEEDQWTHLPLGATGRHSVRLAGAGPWLRPSETSQGAVARDGADMENGIKQLWFLILNWFRMWMYYNYYIYMYTYNNCIVLYIYIVIFLMIHLHMILFFGRWRKHSDSNLECPADIQGWSMEA